MRRSSPLGYWLLSVLGASILGACEDQADSVDAETVVVADATADADGLPAFVLEAAPPARLTVSPSTGISFVTGPGRTPVPVTVGISNPGGSPAPISSIRATGGLPNIAVDASECPATLPALGDCRVGVSLTPASVGRARIAAGGVSHLDGRDHRDPD